MPYPCIGALEQYGDREVIFDGSTDLVCFVRNGATAITATSPTLTLNHGGTKTTATVTAASGTLTATITTTILTALGISEPGAVFEAFWQCTMAGVTNPMRFHEYLWTAPMIIYPALDYTRATALYPELSDSDCLPTGYSDFWHIFDQAWLELRNWMGLHGRGRQMWMIQNPQALSDLHFHWGLAKIAFSKDAALQGSDLWQKRQKVHEGERERLQASALAYFGGGSKDVWTDSDGVEQQTLQPPHGTGRHNRRFGVGLL